MSRVYATARGNLASYDGATLTVAAMTAAYASTDLDPDLATIIGEVDTADAPAYSRKTVVGVWDAATERLRITGGKVTLDLLGSDVASLVFAAPSGALISQVSIGAATPGENGMVFELPDGAAAVADTGTIWAQLTSLDGRVTALEATPPGGGGVASIVAGANITVDATDPANPVVSATGGGGGGLPDPTGAAPGTFLVTDAPGTGYMLAPATLDNVSVAIADVAALVDTTGATPGHVYTAPGTPGAPATFEPAATPAHGPWIPLDLSPPAAPGIPGWVVFPPNFVNPNAPRPPAYRITAFGEAQVVGAAMWVDGSGMPSSPPANQLLPIVHLPVEAGPVNVGHSVLIDGKWSDMAGSPPVVMTASVMDRGSGWGIYVATSGTDGPVWAFATSTWDAA